jgi:GT2 family glycosyltransferase
VLKYSKNHPIYVIDNNSDDKSIDFITNNYSEIRIIKNEINYGYAKGYNKGLRHVEEEIYCLLNNDIEVTKNWINPVLKEFSENVKTVVIQPKILNYNNREFFEYAGAAGGFIDYYGYPYCRGRIFDEIEKDNGQYDDNIEIFWASGACFFIRKSVFDELGGFDENFFNHMEEIDLCWRIENLQKGYKKKFVYKSTVYHLGGGSLDYSDPKKLFYNVRNHKWMLIKNTNESYIFNFNPFSIFNIIHWINLLFVINNLLNLKFFHAIEIINGYFSVWGFKDGVKINMDQNYYLLRSDNKKPKYYVINSIIYNYLILRKRKYSQLNKS